MGGKRVGESSYPLFREGSSSDLKSEEYWDGLKKSMYVCDDIFMFSLIRFMQQETQRGSD